MEEKNCSHQKDELLKPWGFLSTQAFNISLQPELLFVNSPTLPQCPLPVQLPFLPSCFPSVSLLPPRSASSHALGFVFCVWPISSAAGLSFLVGSVTGNLSAPRKGWTAAWSVWWEPRTASPAAPGLLRTLQALGNTMHIQFFRYGFACKQT